MPGVLTHPGLEVDPWLAGELKREVFRLDARTLLGLPASDAARRVDEMCQDRPGPVMIWTRVPVGAPGAVTLVAVLQHAGFTLVDTGMTLERGPFDPAPSQSACEIRAATPEDRSQVGVLARKAFTWSRFHQDPALTEDEANAIKASWATGFFAGRRGDAMSVAIHGDHLVGFLLAVAADDMMVIDLVAVDPAFRSRRVARDLTRHAAGVFPNATRLRVGTQLANTAACLAYQRLGFTLAGAEHVLHFHRSAPIRREA